MMTGGTSKASGSPSKNARGAAEAEAALALCGTWANAHAMAMKANVAIVFKIHQFIRFSPPGSKLEIVRER